MMAIYYFLLGMLEFRSDWTTNPGTDHIEAYDAGRDLAHRLTLRHFDQQ
jgi:hypothetical protein